MCCYLYTITVTTLMIIIIMSEKTDGDEGIDRYIAKLE